MTDLYPLEIWEDIPRHPGYQASTLGRIRSTDRITLCKTKRTSPRKRLGKNLKPFYKTNGYLRVDLCGKCYTVHSLILTTFKGERPKGCVAMHLNDKKDDNRLINLKWGTQSENAFDAIKNKLYVHGRLGRKKILQPNGKVIWRVTEPCQQPPGSQSTHSLANKP